jgi:hypothetical protein
MAKSDPQSGRSSLLSRPMVLRLIWFGLLLTEALFFVYATQWPRRGPGPADAQKAEDAAREIRIADLVMLALLVPGAYIVRGRFFARFRDPRTGAVVPPAYAMGNIIFWSACEGVVLVGLMGVMAAGRLMPGIVIPASATVFQILTFPTGAATRTK